MNRIDPFADTQDPPVFETKPKAKPVPREAIDQIAREQNFPSRQPPRAAASTRRRRTYTTGRNQQINFKATPATVERFYRIADRKKLPLCELLELALDALEKGEKGTDKST